MTSVLGTGDSVILTLHFKQCTPDTEMVVELAF